MTLPGAAIVTGKEITAAMQVAIVFLGIAGIAAGTLASSLSLREKMAWLREYANRVLGR